METEEKIKRLKETINKLEEVSKERLKIMENRKITISDLREERDNLYLKLDALEKRIIEIKHILK